MEAELTDLATSKVAPGAMAPIFTPILTLLPTVSGLFISSPLVVATGKYVDVNVDIHKSPVILVSLPDGAMVMSPPESVVNEL
jgi:hypothetical protein